MVIFPRYVFLLEIINGGGVVQSGFSLLTLVIFWFGKEKYGVAGRPKVKTDASRTERGGGDIVKPIFNKIFVII